MFFKIKIDEFWMSQLSQIIDSINLFWFGDVKDKEIYFYKDTFEFITGCIWYSSDLITDSRRNILLTLVEYIKQSCLYFDTNDSNKIIKQLTAN